MKFCGARYDSKTGHFAIARRALPWWLAAIVVLCCACIACGIWGITRQAELVRLRNQTQLQAEQIRLLSEKTQALDYKMRTLDQLDKEIRQMVKGSESGSLPAGGGDGKEPKSGQAEKEDPHRVLSPTDMSARLSSIDAKARRRLASFYLLRGILKDGAGKDIRELQSITFAAGRSGANSTMPSIWPVKGIITSPFGDRIDPVSGERSFHEGIDIANDYGTPIKATADGIVTIASYTDGYGNLVEIDHGHGFKTRYGHNSTLLVRVGMHVRQGQDIALMGSTGKSTGTHCHYEVRVHDVPVDPLLFLPIQ